MDRFFALLYIYFIKFFKLSKLKLKFIFNIIQHKNDNKFEFEKFNLFKALNYLLNAKKNIVLPKRLKNRVFKKIYIIIILKRN